MKKNTINYLNITKREFEVLKLVIRGYNNNEIGKMLNISTFTAKAYVSSLIEKTGVRNRIHLCYLIGKTNLKP